jgi:hypothetical protein
MPYISTELDVEVDEFLESCSSRELDKVVDWLVEESKINGSLADKMSNPGGKAPVPATTQMQDEFTEGLALLGEAFYRLSTEDQGTLESLIAKYKWT